MMWNWMKKIRNSSATRSRINRKHFEVLLHVTNLQLRSAETGSVEAGGAWISVGVSAPEPNAAGTQARRMLLEDPVFLAQLLNDSLEDIVVDVDEVEEVEALPAGTAPVFYIENE